MRGRESGFTLVELMTTLTIITAMTAMGFFAFRHYWLARALDGSRNEVVTQLRELQQRAQSQSAPLVFGARFTVGSDSYSLVRYTAATSGGSSATCRKVEDRELEDGVQVTAASFASAPGVTSTCQGQVGPGNYVFFFARGSATAGSLTLEHKQIDGRSPGVTVAAVTGRVEEVE